MFQIGDNIVCGNSGVCTVEDIGTLNIGAVPKDRLYYTLKPVYETGGKIFIPVDNDKVVLRFILSKDQVTQLLGDIPQIEQLWIADEKKREQEYRNAVNSCDCGRLVQIIKTLYFRKCERIQNGKKVTAVDDKYFRIAEDRLYEELAIALGISKSEVEDDVRQYIER
ncbi:MAG: CarD family transcriptional regulator [Lachnospiraceae bacterium]